MDRLSFFKNINGISYPDMLVNFFDHIIALKQIINENKCTISVEKNNNTSIEFIVDFNDPQYLNNTMQDISNHGNVVVIYNRTMTVHAEVLADATLKIKLY